MTWAAKYNAVRNEKLMANVSALLTRDFKPALDVLNPGEDLDDFREKALGQVKGLDYPCLGLSPRRGASSPSDDAARVGQAFHFDLQYGVTDDGPDTVTNRIMKYSSTMEAVLLAATKNDFFAGMPGQVFGFVVETEWEFGPFGIVKGVSTLFRAAQMSVTITVNAR